MKLCYVPPEPHADQIGAWWCRALSGEAVPVEQLEQLASELAPGAAFPYDVVLLDATPGALPSVRRIQSALASFRDYLLVLHVAELSRISAERDRMRELLRQADLVLTPSHALSLQLERLFGVRAHEVVPPVSDPSLLVPTVGGRRLFTVLAAEPYSQRELRRDLGLSAYLWTRARYRVQILSTSAPRAERAELVQGSAFVYLPEPVFDGGALSAECARSGALLLAPLSYDPARLLFPYTGFWNDGPRGRRALLLWWLHTSREFAEFFRDTARQKLVHLSDANRRTEFIRKVQYVAPAVHYQPATGSEPSLLDRIRHRSGPSEFHYAEDECCVVCLVRDGEEHLPSFLRHYRELGVNRFVFVDNGSQDTTLALLDREPNVTVYETALAHRDFECELRRLVIEQHCRKRWCLNVDVDELFDYPFSDRVDLRRLVTYLRQSGATAMAGYMLDMYDIENRFEPGGVLDLKQAYPYYDISDITKLDYGADEVRAYCDYNVLLSPRIRCYFGGIRRTVFGDKRGANYLLIKHPLLFLDGTLQPVNHPHYSNRAIVADVSSVLYHYKFTPSFQAKVNESSATHRYVKFAQKQYEQYRARIAGKSSMAIDTPGTQRLRSVEQLLQQGFVYASDRYRNYAAMRDALTSNGAHGDATWLAATSHSLAQ